MNIPLNELLARRNSVRAIADQVRQHLAEVQILVQSLEKAADGDLTKALAEANPEAGK